MNSDPKEKDRSEWNQLHPYIERCRKYMYEQGEVKNAYQIAKSFKNKNHKTFKIAIYYLLRIREWKLTEAGFFVPNPDHFNYVPPGSNKNINEILKRKEWIAIERAKNRPLRLMKAIYSKKNRDELSEAMLKDAKAHPEVLDTLIRFHITKRKRKEGRTKTRKYVSAMLEKARKYKDNPFVLDPKRSKFFSHFFSHHRELDYIDPFSRTGQDMFLRLLRGRIYVSGYDETKEITKKFRKEKLSKIKEYAEWRI